MINNNIEGKGVSDFSYKNNGLAKKVNQPSMYSTPPQFMLHLKGLLSSKEVYPWLEQFYQDKIKLTYQSFIDHQLFGVDSNFQAYYQHDSNEDSALTQLKILKSFFTQEPIKPYNIAKLLRPLRKKIANDALKDNFSWAWPLQTIEGDLTSKLQDELIKAIKSKKTQVGVFVSDAASTLLLDMLHLQILFCIHERAKKLKHELDDLEKSHEVEVILQWAEREINSRVPSQENTEQTSPLKKRKTVLGEIPNQLIYFLNGTDRLTHFLLYEYLKFREIAHLFKSRRKAFIEGNWHWSDLFFNLPIKSAGFFMDVTFVALMPYRLMRTFVNELTRGIFKLVRSSFSQYLPKSRQKKGMFVGLYYASQIGFYISMLYLLGLPVFPNPISWLPANLLYAFPVISTSYFATVILSSIYEKYFGQFFTTATEEQNFYVRKQGTKILQTENPLKNIPLLDFSEKRQANSYFIFDEKQPSLLESNDNKKRMAPPAA